MNKVYFTTRFNDSGELEGYNKRNQFLIPVNSEVRFTIDAGIKISKNAKLLINKPQVNTKTGTTEYTITQPMTIDDDQSFTYEGS